MSVEKRVRLCRLVEKIERHPEQSSRLGLQNESRLEPDERTTGDEPDDE